MIAILRLKLGGKVRCGLPMEDKHFHFCRHAGMYHYLIEDMPHALIAFAKWRLGCDDGDDGSVSDGDGLDAKLSQFRERFISNESLKWFALGSAGLSACSITFGLVNKAVQMRIARMSTTPGVADSIVTEPFAREIERLKQRIADQEQHIADLTSGADRTAAAADSVVVATSRGAASGVSRPASPLRENLLAVAKADRGHGGSELGDATQADSRATTGTALQEKPPT